MTFNSIEPSSTKIIVDNLGINVSSPVLFGKNVTTYNYKTITSIQINSGIIFADVTIYTINRVLSFRFFKGEGKRFHQLILPRLNN